MPIYIYAGVTSALLGGAVGYSIGSSGKKEPVLNSDLQNYNQKCHLESGTYLTCIDQSRKMVQDMSNNPTDLRKYQASIKINDFNAPILLSQNFFQQYYICNEVITPKFIYSSWYDLSPIASVLYLQVKTIYNLNKCLVK